MPKTKQRTKKPVNTNTDRTIADELGVAGKVKPDVDPNSLSEQADVFNPFSGEVETVSGEKIKIPKLAFGKNLEIGNVIESLIDDYKNESGVDILALKPEDGTWALQDVRTLVSFVATFVPRKLAEITGIILGREYTWVLDNLDEEGVVVVLMGFFGRKAAMARLLLQAAVGGFVSPGTN